VGPPPRTEHVRFCNGTNGVGTLQLNRPEVRDALSEQMADEILMLCKYFERMEPAQLRCLILTGSSEKSFSSGRDLKASASHSTREDRLRYLRAAADSVEAVHKLPVPTIASIEGACMGWGLELALGCDIRVCSPTARMRFPETSLGIFPGAGGCVLLQEVVAKAVAKELIFTAREFDGAEAKELGVTSAAVEDPLQLAYHLGEKIAENGPLGVRNAKRVISGAYDMTEERAMELSRLLREPLNETEDFKEAIAAFNDGKRRPNFRGK